MALVSACGSTALRGGAAASSDPVGLNAGTSTAPVSGGGSLDTPTSNVPAATDPTGSTGGTVPGSQGSGAFSGGSGSVAGTGSAGGSSTTGTATTPVTNVGGTTKVPRPVVTVAPKAPIRLGIIGLDTSALAAKFGQKATDPFASIKPMVTYLNAHGGVAGHLIKPVYTRVDSEMDASQGGQLACTALTQDNTVDMVLTLAGQPDTLLNCLGQKGVSLFSTSNWTSDAQWMAQYPNLFMPTAMRTDRYEAALITSAVQRGALKSGDKLGVVVENCDWGNRIYDNVIVPTATKYGVTPIKTTITCITNLVQDLGPVTNDITRDVLTLAAGGATHVLAVSQAEAYVDAVFTQVASTQKYLPKYLVSTTAYPGGDQSGPVHFSPDALPNISGLGFMPLLDVGGAAKPTTAQAAAQATCTKMDPKQGGAAAITGDAKYFGLNSFYSLCDTFNAISFVLTNNGNKFGLGDMAAGFQKLLAKGVSASGVGGTYGGGNFRHDGLGLGQSLAYNSTTKHFNYVGSMLSIT